MKNLKVQLSGLAIVLGLAGAFASSAATHNFSNKTWGRNADGTYTDVTGEHQGTDYSCKSSTAICTAVYPATQDPNLNPANPISTVLGDFSN
jgi:hypothetical protein